MYKDYCSIVGFLWVLLIKTIEFLYIFFFLIQIALSVCKSEKYLNYNL